MSEVPVIYDDLNAFLNTVESWSDGSAQGYDSEDCKKAFALVLFEARDKDLLSKAWTARFTVTDAERRASEARDELLALKVRLFDAGIAMPKKPEAQP